ncbi:MAG: flagellar hook assembly protein FlgD [Azonexus sp.]
MSVSTATETLQALGLGTASTASTATSDKADRTKLDQDDFLTLMMTQLKCQDPSKPMDGTAMVSQMAQFSTVSGIETLNKSFAAFSASMTSGQVLQASQMVGRSALVPSTSVTLDPAAGVTATVNLSAMVPDLSLNLYDTKGQLVRSMSIQGQGPGLVDVKWDGLNDAGEALPAGQYRLEATGSINGENQAFETLSLKKIEGVTLDPEGGQPLLEMAGGDSIALDKVREIR